MTNKELETIQKNLNAYLAHFQPIEIKKVGRDFYVYQNGDENYIQCCPNIHYLNGWLYGAVQMHCKVIRTK